MSLTLLFNKIILFLLNRIIPFPIVNELAAKLLMKYQLWIILLILIGLMLIPLFHVNGAGIHTPEKLTSYIENLFTDTNIPKGSPLGGIDMDLTHVTAFYKDELYYKRFNRWHDGIDIIPNTRYYNESKAYQLTKEIILIATLSGDACSRGSNEEGLTLEITSIDESIKVLYHHQKVNFVPVGECIKIIAGTPIGIMGATGNATGIHCHYMIFQKQNSTWKHVDPLPFMTITV